MNNGYYVLFPNQSNLAPSNDLKFTQFLINQAPDAVFCVEENAQFFYVNDEACRITEYSREELLRMCIKDIDVEFSPEYWPKRWQWYKSRGSFCFQSLLQTKTGKIFAVEMTIKYLEHEGKEFICAFIRNQTDELAKLREQKLIDTLLDANELLLKEVSDLRNKEEELETSLSIVRSTLDSTANGIIAINYEGDIISVNKKFIEMWQIPESLTVSRKCPVSKSFFENKVKEPEAFRRLVWEVSSQSDFESYDVLELKDGRKFAHYCEPQQIGERIIGRVWSVWDVTESSLSEEALKVNEARFRTLAEETDSCIFLIYGMQICYINPAVEALTGYTRKELLNNFHLLRLIKSRKRRQIRNKDGGMSSEYQEMQILTKNGVERWLACSVTLLDGGLDFAGKQIEMVTATDITDYKHVEQEVRQALEQAKQLSDLRARFISMVCHQFRTPLNIVSFSNSLLRRHIDQLTDDKKLPLLDNIQTAVEQISELLDKILLLGRAEAAKLNFQPKPLDVIRFCEQLVAGIHLTSTHTPINFVSEGNYPTAYIDKKLLETILTNLLDNAIKYSPNNSIVDFKLFWRNKKVIFQIKDNGIGIPAEDRERLFEPFHRGRNVDGITGTGLGLSIVKTLVDLHKGEIDVDSEIGFGTTFTVTLPSGSR